MSREADKMRAHEEHRKTWRKARASEKKPSVRSVVLKKYPEAFCTKIGRERWVYAADYDLQPIGEGKTVAAAWGDAAKKLNNSVDSGKAS